MFTYTTSTSPLVSLCFDFVRLMLNRRAMLITFYRPWGMEFPEEIDPNAKADWQHRMRLKADHAASQTNEILDRLVQDGLLGLVGPMT